MTSRFRLILVQSSLFLQFGSSSTSIWVPATPQANPTGERFIVGRAAEETRNEPITVVTEWPARLPDRNAR